MEGNSPGLAYLILTVCCCGLPLIVAVSLLLGSVMVGQGPEPRETHIHITYLSGDQEDLWIDPRKQKRLDD